MHTIKKSIAIVLVYNLIWTQAFANPSVSAGAPPKLPPVYPPTTYSDGPGGGSGGSGGGSGQLPPSSGPSDSGGNEDSVDKIARRNLSTGNIEFRALETQEKILLRDLADIERKIQSGGSRLTESSRSFLTTRHSAFSADLSRVHSEMMKLIQSEVARIRSTESGSISQPRTASSSIPAGNQPQPQTEAKDSRAGWLERTLLKWTERLGLSADGRATGTVNVPVQEPSSESELRDQLRKNQTQNESESERRARAYQEERSLRRGTVVGRGGQIAIVDPESSLSYELQRAIQQGKAPSIAGDLAQQRASETRGQEIPKNRALVLIDGSPVQRSSPVVRNSPSGQTQIIRNTVPSQPVYTPNPLDSGRAQSTGGYFNWKGEHVPWEIERPNATRSSLSPSSFRQASASYWGDTKEFSKDIPLNMAIIMGVIGLMSCSKAEFSYAHNPEACISFFAQTKDPWFYAQFISMMMVAHGLSYKMGLAHGPSMTAQVAKNLFQGSVAGTATSTAATPASATSQLKLPFLSAFAWTAATAVTMVGVEFLRDPDVQLLIKNTHSQPSMACKIREAKGGAGCTFEESQASVIRHSETIDQAWKRVFEKFSDMEQLRNVDIVIGTVFATTLAVVGGMNAFKSIATRVGATYRLPSLSLRIPILSNPTFHVVARTTVVIGAFFAVASLIAPILAEAVTTVRGSGHLLVGLNNMTRDLSKGLGLPNADVRGLILDRSSGGSSGINLARTALQSDLKRIEKYFADREAQDYETLVVGEEVQPPLLPTPIVERRLKRELDPVALMGLLDRTTELQKSMSKRYGYIASDFLGKYSAWSQHITTFINETASSEKFLRDFYAAAITQKKRGLNPGQFLGRGLQAGDRTLQGPIQEGAQRNILIARAISRGIADWSSVIWLSNQNLERLLKWNDQGLSTAATGMLSRYIQTFESGELIGSTELRPSPQTQPLTEMIRYLNKLDSDIQEILAQQGSSSVSASEVRSADFADLENSITNHVLKTTAVPGVADAPRTFIEMIKTLSQNSSNLAILGGGNAREGLQKLLRAQEAMQRSVDYFETRTFLDGSFQTVPNPDNFWTAETWGRNGLVTHHEGTAISFRSRLEHLAIYLLCGANPFTESNASFLRRDGVASRPGLAPPRISSEASKACGVNIPLLSSVLGRQTTQGNLLTTTVPGLDGASDGWLFSVLAQKLPKDLSYVRNFKTWFDQEPGLRLADAYVSGATELNRSFAKMARESLRPVWDKKETQSARTWYSGETTERTGRWWWERAWEPIMSWWTGHSNPAPEQDRIADPELLNLSFASGLRLAILNDAAVGLKMTALAAYALGVIVPNTSSSNDFLELLLARYDILAIRPSSMTETQARRFDPFFPVVVQDPPAVQLDGMQITAREIAESQGSPELSDSIFQEMLLEYRAMNSKPWLESKDPKKIHQQIRQRLDTVLATYWLPPTTDEDGESYKSLVYNSLRSMTGVLDGASNNYGIFQRNLEDAEIVPSGR